MKHQPAADSVPHEYYIIQALTLHGPNYCLNTFIQDNRGSIPVTVRTMTG